MSEPLRVLFVCTANICRSPLMELLAERLADGALAVSSAGTHGFEGRPVDAEMTAPLLARGVATERIEGFRSRPLTLDLVADADLVLTAEAFHGRVIVEELPEAAPKVFTLGQFAAVVGDAAGLAGAELVREVGARQHPTDPALDVMDPYRRGSEAAALCAQQVEALLRVAVPALAGSGRITP